MWSGMYTFWNRKLEKVEKKIKLTRHRAAYTKSDKKLRQFCDN